MKYWFIRESSEATNQIKDSLKPIILRIFDNNTKYLDLLDYIEADSLSKYFSSFESWLNKLTDRQLISFLVEGMHGGAFSSIFKDFLTNNSYISFCNNFFREYRSYLKKQTRFYLESLIKESTCFIDPFYDLIVNWLNWGNPSFIEKYLYLKEVKQKHDVYDKVSPSEDYTNQTEIEKHVAKDRSLDDLLTREYILFILLSSNIQAKVSDFYPCFKQEINAVYQKFLHDWDIVADNTKQMKDFPQQLLMKWDRFMDLNTRFRFLSDVKKLEVTVEACLEVDGHYEQAINQAKELLR